MDNGMSRAEFAVEDGHDCDPNGQYEFYVDLNDIGFHDVEVTADWELIKGSLMVYGIWASDGSVSGADLMCLPELEINATPLQSALRKRLVDEVMKREQIILEEFHDRA